MAEGGRQSGQKAERERRLAAALRANLKRRKARSRGGPETGRATEEPGDEAGRYRSAAPENEES
ncbi:MAG TPA: hypothetical protein VN240_08905 [Propylenella sp.]|jgi:hypothetical protein|nr:hypothetical protein [Propylenella sp.]